MHSLFSLRTIKQFFGYGAVGLLNTALNFLLINTAIFLTGITSGALFLTFSFAVFCVVVLHSFFWNRYLIFKRENPAKAHREYLNFFLVSGVSALISLFILHMMVDIIGAQWGISAHLWANVAITVTIPSAVVCNFLGYKFFVFVEKPLI